jgi:hypothetical protein
MKMSVDISAGRERLMRPLIRLPYLRDGTEIYQPMFRHEIFEADPQLYDTNFVRNMSMNWNHGIGWPLSDDGFQLTKLLPDLSLRWIPKEAFERHALHDVLTNQTMNFQADLWDYLYVTPNSSVRSVVKKCQQLNRRWGKDYVPSLERLRRSKK